MKAVKLLTVCAFALFASSPAFAWPSCPGNWNQVPSGTKATGSSGQVGEIYTSGGLTWQCQGKTPPPPPSHDNNHDNNHNKNQQNEKQGQSQNQTATGGSVGPISVKATGGQGGAGGSSNQQQSNSSANTNSNSASAANNGNGSNNTTTETNVEASKIPVATAYAPTVIPTVTCFKGYGAGVQTAPAGVSFGGGKIDENCAILEAARAAHNLRAFCKVYLTNKYVKKSGLTLEECLEQQAPVVASVVVAPVIEKPVEVVKEVPVETLVYVPQAFEPQLVGICTFASQFSCNIKTKTPGNPTHVTNICDQMLRQAVDLVRTHPNTIIRLVGNQNNGETERSTMYSLARAKNVQRRLVALGVSPDLVVTATGTTGDRTVEVWVVTK